MPPVESLKALVSYVMTLQTDKDNKTLVLAVYDVSCAGCPLLRSVCKGRVREATARTTQRRLCGKVQQDDVRDTRCLERVAKLRRGETTCKRTALRLVAATPPSFAKTLPKAFVTEMTSSSRAQKRSCER
eukprot:560921-Amphidinium_carterae.1